MRNPFRRKTTELERFLTYLNREASYTFGGGSAHYRAEREDEQDHARIILSFATDTTVGSAPPETIEELVDLVSPDHEGWGLDRRPVENWVHRFREQDQ